MLTPALSLPLCVFGSRAVWNCGARSDRGPSLNPQAQVGSAPRMLRKHCCASCQGRLTHVLASREGSPPMSAFCCEVFSFISLQNDAIPPGWMAAEMTRRLQHSYQLTAHQTGRVLSPLTTSTEHFMQISGLIKFGLSLSYHKTDYFFRAPLFSTEATVTRVFSPASLKLQFNFLKIYFRYLKGNRCEAAEWTSCLWYLGGHLVATWLLVNCLCFSNMMVIPCIVVDTEQLSVSRRDARKVTKIPSVLFRDHAELTSK